MRTSSGWRRGVWRINDPSGLQRGESRERRRWMARVRQSARKPTVYQIKARRGRASRDTRRGTCFPVYTLRARVEKKRTRFRCGFAPPSRTTVTAGIAGVPFFAGPVPAAFIHCTSATHEISQAHHRWILRGLNVVTSVGASRARQSVPSAPKPGRRSAHRRNRASNARSIEYSRLSLCYVSRVTAGSRAVLFHRHDGD